MGSFFPRLAAATALSAAGFPPRPANTIGEGCGGDSDDAECDVALNIQNSKFNSQGRASEAQEATSLED
jgi:hypothetical protein